MWSFFLGGCDGKRELRGLVSFLGTDCANIASENSILLPAENLKLEKLFRKILLYNNSFTLFTQLIHYEQSMQLVACRIVL